MKSSIQDRRARAKARFSIMSLGQWDATRFQKGRQSRIDEVPEAYAAYVARKTVEARALGVK